MINKYTTPALIILLSTSSFAGKPSLSPSTPGNTPSETQTPGGQNNGTGSPPNKDAPQNNAPIPGTQGISNTSNAGTSIGTAVSAALLTGVAGVGIGAVGNNWVKNKELKAKESAMETRLNKAIETGLNQEIDKVKEGFNSLTLPWDHPVAQALSKKYKSLSEQHDKESATEENKKQLSAQLKELEGWNKKTPVELHNLAKKYLENDYVKPEGNLHHHYQVFEKVVARL
jgi:hypothetical protein